MKKEVGRVVVKLGSSIVTSKNSLNKSYLDDIVEQIRLIRENGFSVILVVSGAFAYGEKRVSAANPNRELVAAVGQAYLITQLVNFFSQHKVEVAQILLTKSDLDNAKKKEQLKNSLEFALAHNIIPILNENDVVEINSFGGNDYLGAEVAKLVKADFFLLLTDVEGVYDKSMQLIDKIHWNSSFEFIEIKKVGNNSGTGGMKRKVHAARLVSQHGIQTIIASGMLSNILPKILLHKEDSGTKFTHKQYEND